MAQSKKNDVESENAEPLPECFVIMPIADPEGYVPGHFADVYRDIIEPACEMNGFKPHLASNNQSSHIIHVEILRKLIDSPMAICDLSNRNPNVLFELGLRQAFDKPTVIIQEKGTKQIFDTNIIHYTEYRKEMIYKEVLEDQEKIAEAFAQTLKACKDPENSNSIIKLLSLSQPAMIKTLSKEDETNSMLRLLMREVNTIKNMSRPMRIYSDGSRSEFDFENFISLVKSELSRIDKSIADFEDPKKIAVKIKLLKSKIYKDMEMIGFNSEQKSTVYNMISKVEEDLERIPF